jgi:hypothetical protein
VLQKVIPSHQSTIRGERLVAATQMKLPARWQKFEIQFSFTHWVKQFFVGFRLQTPSPVAHALPILNLNCGLEIDGAGMCVSCEESAAQECGMCSNRIPANEIDDDNLRRYCRHIMSRDD